MKPKRGFRAEGHAIRIRDLRVRFGDPEAQAAECSCGWLGPTRGGRYADRHARHDGGEHLEREAGRERLSATPSV